MKIDWIDSKLGLSGAIDDYNELERQQVKAVINLRSEMHDDVLELTKRGIAYYWLPLVDNLAPSMSFHMPILRRILKDIGSDRVLIHCTQGIGRSASIALMYIIDKLEVSPESALLILKDVRPSVHMTDVQLNKVKQYYERER